METDRQNCWLVKQEPEAYAFGQLKKDKKTTWDGVRNFQARNYLRLMNKGDPVLFYHSVKIKSIVGLCKVSKAYFPDPTAEEGDWSAVEISYVRDFETPVSLEAIKAEKDLRNIALIKQSRLSVMPLAKVEFTKLCIMGGIAP